MDLLRISVYLDGRTEDGRTIYKNKDMSPHQHKQQQQQSQSQPEPTFVKILNAKLDRIIALLEREQ